MRASGYAARWNAPDRAGDLFRAGSLKPGEYPLLWQHRGDPVGTASVVADDSGLRADLVIRDPEAARLVRARALTGLSVGYRPRVVSQGAWREIHAADLVEVSLVAQPMQPDAWIDWIANSAMFEAGANSHQ